MNRKNYFEKYYSRLRSECLLKSFLCGLIVGAALAFIAAFVTWFFPHFNGLWLSIGILVLCSAAATPLFYYTIFKPTVMANARRLDRLGLDERLITMVEYENDESYIAKCQREDAARQLNKIDVKAIKFDIPKKIILTVSIVAFLGLGMTTVTGLSELGILPSGDEVIDIILPPPDPIWYEVNYEVMEGGEIVGDPFQIVEKGQATEQVIAVPEDGWIFDGWEDGMGNPVRFDVDVQQNMTIVAIFLPLSDGMEMPGEGPGKPGNMPGKQPGQDGPAEGEEPNPDPSNSGGGKYEEQNQIIDGKTYYKDPGVYDMYYDAAMEQLAQSPDLTPEQKAIIESYFEIIA
jgi:hypothetical protein